MWLKDNDLLNFVATPFLAKFPVGENEEFDLQDAWVLIGQLLLMPFKRILY